MITPEDVDALNIAALESLRAGDGARAAAILKRAAELHPAHARTRHHLGRVLEMLGDAPAALAAHEAAVRLDPALPVARLYYANLLAHSGSADAALLQWARALQDAQARGQWVNRSTTPEALRPAVEHAVRSVRAGRKAALARLLEPLIATHGRAALARVERALRIYFKEEAPVYSDPRQQPTFLFFPDLPPAAYPDRSMFAWIEALEAQTPAILEELRQLLPSSSGRERVFTSDDLERANLRGSDVAPPTWNGYYFYRHGKAREDNCASCPATARALGQLPLMHLRDHGPEVLFSVFTPGTHLLPHRGVTNTRLVGHLPLIVPENCALTVGGEVHVWQPGRVVVFDDSYEHEAWNRSNEIRVVLIFDIWHPQLTDVERAAVGELVAAMGDFREAVQRS